EARCDQVERVVPRRALAVDLRMEQPPFETERLRERRAFRAEPPGVCRVLRVARDYDARDARLRPRRDDAAADAAVRARRANRRHSRAIGDAAAFAATVSSATVCSEAASIGSTATRMRPSSMRTAK